MTDDVPADTGSADPGVELRKAATLARQRHREGSPAYGFWRITAGIWDRWAERVEMAIDLSPVAHAEFQAALFSARQYVELQEGGSERVVAAGPLSCARCGHEFISPGDDGVRAEELGSMLLDHVCDTPEQ